MGLSCHGPWGSLGAGICISGKDLVLPVAKALGTIFLIRAQIATVHDKEMLQNRVVSV